MPPWLTTYILCSVRMVCSASPSVFSFDIYSLHAGGGIIACKAFSVASAGVLCNILCVWRCFVVLACNMKRRAFGVFRRVRIKSLLVLYIISLIMRDDNGVSLLSCLAGVSSLPLRAAILCIYSVGRHLCYIYVNDIPTLVVAAFLYRYIYGLSVCCRRVLLDGRWISD